MQDMEFNDLQGRDDEGGERYNRDMERIEGEER